MVLAVTVVILVLAAIFIGPRMRKAGRNTRTRMHGEDS
jgi:hypothetical protein